MTEFIKDIDPVINQIATMDKTLKELNDARESKYVPYRMNEYVHINPDGTDMTVNVDVTNYGSAITYNSTAANTIQFWISYRDEDGNTLTSSSMSTAFDPETITYNEAPSGSVSTGTRYTWNLSISGVHHEKPEGAHMWSFTLRPVSVEMGTMGFNTNATINTLHVHGA